MAIIPTRPNPITLRPRKLVWAVANKRYVPIVIAHTAPSETVRVRSNLVADWSPLRPNPRASMLAANANDLSMVSSRTGITIPARAPSLRLRPRRDSARRTRSRLSINWGAKLMATETAVAISKSAPGVDFKSLRGLARVFAIPRLKTIVANRNPSTSAPRRL